MVSQSLRMASSLICLCVILLTAVPFSAGLAVMSVDFGNEFMKIAIVKPGVPMEIVLNKESRRKTPTTIYLKDGDRLVGDPAVTMAIRYPKYGYRYLLDVLGKHYDNPLVQLYKKRFPHNNLIRDEETGMVLFKHEEDVFYTPEELIAMILQKAKEYAETFAEQSINEAVITVPSYFNQAERRAMSRAADSAGLRLLQLINDNTAVALNYGVFRHKVFNSTALNYMFFDIGATGTTATIVAYQVVKNPGSSADTYPQLTIRGIGFDRTLGGVEFQLRLRDYLAEHFNKVKRAKKDVTGDARAMQKLFKEAGRVKQVLSANTDHFAQVESLFEDEDFRVKVTREEFEHLCQDLVDRVDKVIKDALTSAELPLDDIEEVILMGGGTRIPKVQQAIKTAVKREELGKGINTDEAAALGAVYQAAHLGKGFKVKKFGVKDATVYPIKVEFERARTKEGDLSSVLSDSTSKVVKRVLFGRMQPYPQKKVITFNKHVRDFTFDVSYGDLGFMSTSELSEFGSTHLQTVSLAGVADAHSKHSDAEAKGIKAYFCVDDSGLLYLDKVEAQFEKTTTEEVETVEESTLSKIGNTISNLFGGGKKEEAGEASSEGSPEETVPETAGESVDSEKQEPEKQDVPEQLQSESAETNKSQESEEPKTEEPVVDTSQKSEGAASQSKESKSEDADKAKAGDSPDTDKKSTESEEKKPEVKIKTTTVRANITFQTTVRDLQDPSAEKLKKSKKLIAKLKKLEEEKDLLEKVKNEIEAFVFDAQDRLEQRDYKLCSTEDERVAISAKLSEASDWLIEQDDTTPRKEFEAKLNDLKAATKDVYERVNELHERPTAIAALNSMVNHSEFFLAFMKNFTGEDLPFTQVEFDVLDKMVNDTREWNNSVQALQAKTPLTEKPKFTIEDVAVKIAALDREVKYLVNKIKSYRPKTKPKAAKESNTTDSASNETKTNEEPIYPAEDTTTTTKDELDRDILENVTDKEEKLRSTDDKSHNHEPDDEL